MNHASNNRSFVLMSGFSSRCHKASNVSKNGMLRVVNWRKYKRSVVTGMVHRIFRACSTWSNFHESLKKAKLLLTNNQYPESFYEPLIEQTLEHIIRANSKTNEDTEESNDEDEQCLIFLQYRGKITEQYIRSLHILEAPCKIVLTLRKLSRPSCLR